MTSLCHRSGLFWLPIAGALLAGVGCADDAPARRDGGRDTSVDAGEGAAGSGGAGDAAAMGGSGGNGGAAGSGDADAGIRAACDDGRRASSERCDPSLDGCCNRTCDGVLAANTVCRAAAGPCDVEEVCDGAEPGCPPDGVVPAATECRAPAGACDVADTCDGTRKQCPDRHAARGTPCRASAGPCDAAEVCSGNDPGCPLDALLPMTAVCRAAVADCDAPEYCAGDSVTCPFDELWQAGHVCRGAVDGCDAAELCDGSSLPCPPDLPDHCALGVLGATLPIDVAGDTTLTCDTLAPSCAGAGDREQVFVFTAPSSATYDLNTLGSSFDTALYVLDGPSCGAAELACDDDYMMAPSSRINMDLAAGQTVLVVVDGWDVGDRGAFLLHIDVVPAAYTCDPHFFGADDGCDCGCGVMDPDCPAASSLACDYCNEAGSCDEAGNGCPGGIDGADNSQCSGSGPPAPSWICNPAFYGANDGCDCGCGIVDPDCIDASADACEFCNWNGSCDATENDCPGIIDPTDNASCRVIGWNCDPNLFGTSDGCDCGCGVPDPDCAGDPGVSACDYCANPGSCSAGSPNCPGSIDPGANSGCL